MALFVILEYCKYMVIKLPNLLTLLLILFVVNNKYLIGFPGINDYIPSVSQFKHLVSSFSSNYKVIKNTMAIKKLKVSNYSWSTRILASSPSFHISD